MRKIIIILMLLLTMFIPVASADIVDDLENKVGEYNQNTEYVPSYLKFSHGRRGHQAGDRY